MNRKKKNYVIIFALIVVSLSVGYATFAQPIAENLSFIPTHEWNVGFVDAKRTGITGNTEELSPVSHNLTKGWFNVVLSNPGDSVTYTFTVKNQGIVDAKVKSIYTFADEYGSEAIMFDVNGLAPGDILKPGETASLNVTASYNPNYNGDEVFNRRLYVLVNYAQK